MQTSNELFFKEFNNVMLSKSAINRISLATIPLPEELVSSKVDLSFEQVLFSGIEEEYYGKLNGTTAYLLSRPRLTRKKYNSNGDYVRDKDGNYFTEDVTVPTSCVAILSKIKLGVPRKWVSKSDGFIYVDLFASEKELYYIYIIPREFCYKLNLVALSISLDKPHKFYAGCQVYLKTGHKVFVYIAPYRVTSVPQNRRIITVKSCLDLNKEYKELLTSWIENGIIYDIQLLWLSETIKDRNNAGYVLLDGTLDEYLRYDINKPMSSLLSTNDELDNEFGAGSGLS